MGCKGVKGAPVARPKTKLKLQSRKKHSKKRRVKVKRRHFMGLRLGRREVIGAVGLGGIVGR